MSGRGAPGPRRMTRGAAREVLGVGPGEAGDRRAVKRAYRAAAREHHPDVSRRAGAEARFIEVRRGVAFSPPLTRTLPPERRRKRPWELGWGGDWYYLVVIASSALHTRKLKW